MQATISRVFAIVCMGVGAIALTLLSRPEGGELETVVAATTVPQESAADRFVVHEWGTFTNFSGADGVQLDFRPNVEQDLPRFVYNRFRQAQSPFGKLQLLAPLRMETPVTYFYSNRPREVNVSVKFPQGLLTEFYPPVKSMGPAYTFNRPAPLANSFLNWGKVKILPAAQFAQLRLGSGKAATLPAVGGDDHYGFARETDSAVLDTTDQYGGRHFEKFLFYRGVGKYKLPLTLEAREGGKFVVHNSGEHAVGAMFLVHIENGKVRYVHAPQLPAHASLQLELPLLADDGLRFCNEAAPASHEPLRDEVVQALVGTGLYEKEARAMVKTWQSSWFGEEGTRLFYLVPQQETDAILPLAIEPAPAELVRVLVGRIETLTPEREAQLRFALEGAGTCVSAHSEPMLSELKRLGRFAEPALERIARTSADDDPLRAAATGLIAELRQ